MKRSLLALVAALLVGAFAVPMALADSDPSNAVYEVRITNIATGQPLSPPVVATHSKAVRLFEVGEAASHAVEAIAENGDQSGAVAALESSDRVTDVVDVGVPLTRSGTAVGDFADSVEFTIEAARGDRLSFATMLICTNDGFTGLDSVKLPKRGNGTVTFHAAAYDAGTEQNTEASEDIVDPCSALGPFALDGDPNGNVNDGIDTDGVIAHHAGIAGGADLDESHDWEGAIATVEVTLLSDAGNVHEYDITLTNLSDGQPFSPPVAATHAPRFVLQGLGSPAGAAIELIAENGDQSDAYAWLSGRKRVTDVVDIGRPLTRAGTVVGDFTDSATFTITARPGDQLSLAGMLICTNDGLVLADRLTLPHSGAATY